MNWGKSITIVIILFMSFILFMVFKLASTKVDLVSEDYYAQELVYEDEIQARSNALNMGDEVLLVQEKDIIRITFPEAAIPSDSIGYIHFYRPDNAQFDHQFTPAANEIAYTIPREKVVPGRYKVKVKWVSNGEAYVTEKQIFIE